MFDLHLQALLAETGLALLVPGGDLPPQLLYLDPGTGSLLFSVIVGIASTAYFVAKDLLYRAGTRVRMLLSPRSGAALRAAQREEHPVVFYSEGRQYRSTFGPLLQQMQRRGLPCLYLSSDAEDPLLALGQGGQYPQLRTEHIGHGHMAWARLRTLRARVVCMTTPGLDVLQIRRSPHVRHYMHIVHSPTDKSFNRPYSFDFFDSVLINGPHQERVIRCLEELRGRRRKELFSEGCVYYDSLVPRYAAASEVAALAKGGAPQRVPRVLLAPTWGKNGLLTRYGSPLIRAIAEAGLELVIRPHPQSARSEAELLARLQRECAALPNCCWDFNADPVEAMAMSDILVSDISGIVFDYAFLTGRPVLTMDFSVDKRGFEAMDLPFEPWELSSLELIGRRIGLDDVPALPKIIREETTSPVRATQIRLLRDTHVLNFGHASEAAVERIAQLAGLDAQAQPLEAAPGAGLALATALSA
ncbi:CDP-glycerol glycerophosphotransferase family protein [Azohydromonas caseinilytica]|uniref:CDP-Glycerol:Poly(Glycerophosphate) glycerophosphotransferase n=1 Tax=Azohydromonas caseinilytica TaxID=2728836 RepID=A0A848F7L0_9BURK|nr:CDP-glycerol glycerophosphotransferase family protein [Azohydromonas caseinilytica]NML16087.1 hypothetical protein [Azohydromonas caseinilytica]